MAKKPGRNNQANELKEEIAHSREQVGRNLRGLRYELDVPRKIRNSFRREPLPWIATAAAVGIFVVLMVARRKKIYVTPTGTAKPAPEKFLTAGLALGVLKIASTLLKPAIIGLVEKKLSGAPPSPRPARRV